MKPIVTVNCTVRYHCDFRGETDDYCNIANKHSGFNWANLYTGAGFLEHIECGFGKREAVFADRVTPPPTTEAYKKAPRSGEATMSKFIMDGVWEGFTPPPLPDD